MRYTLGWSLGVCAVAMSLAQATQTESPGPAFGDGGNSLVLLRHPDSGTCGGYGGIDEGWHPQIGQQHMALTARRGAWMPHGR